MTTRVLVILKFCLALAFLPQIAQAQIKVNGQVIDEENKQAVSNVHVSIMGSTKGTITDDKGEFSITLNSLPVEIYFSCIGYIIDNYLVTEFNVNTEIEIILKKEIIEINEVAIHGERVQRMTNGDTINITDYQILKDRIILVGNPYKRAYDQRIYLADLNGDTLMSRRVKGLGRMIKYPEIMTPQLVQSFKDCFGEIQILTREKVWQLFINRDSLYLIYPTPYEDFLSILFPMKLHSNGGYVYQLSDKTHNHTYLYRDGVNLLVKTVYDKYGDSRYIELGHPDFYKYVSAPVFSDSSRYIHFDFFGNAISFINTNGQIIGTTPISFHQKEVVTALILREKDLDQRNFTQQIYYDSKTGKFYAYYKLRNNGKQSVREIDITTGNIVRVLEIPGYPNISKVCVYNNSLYFLYSSKTQPYYQSLYRMRI